MAAVAPSSTGLMAAAARSESFAWADWAREMSHGPLLQAVAMMEFSESRVVETGRPDVVTRAGIRRECSRQPGLGRLLIPAPVLTPRWSAWWPALVTPETGSWGPRIDR